MPVFFTNYNRPASPGFSSDKESKTLQQFKNEADINFLIARYSKTGFFYDPLARGGKPRPPQFGDFSNFGDFAEQQNRILSIYDSFAALPSSVREKFGHNPATFVEFCGDPKNFNDCVEMGIFPKPVKPAEPVVDPVADPAPVVVPDPNEVKK